jgi:hypothetical protein
VMNGKNICRSAGLSESLEIIYRIKKGDPLGYLSNLLLILITFPGLVLLIIRNHIFISHTSTSKSQYRLQDVDWLKALKVKYICDLMVENAVKLSVVLFDNDIVTIFNQMLNLPFFGFGRFGVVSLCSSEQKEKTHQTFHHSAMPYPGMNTFHLNLLSLILLF